MTTMYWIWFTLGGPWTWFVEPEVAMYTQLAYDWCAVIISLIFLRDKIEKGDDKYNWYYFNLLWRIIEERSNNIINKALLQTESWGDTRRRSKFKTNLQIAHRSKRVTSSVKLRIKHTILATTVIFVSVKGSHGQHQRPTSTFDSDSYLLHVDNCASRCVTNNINDFVSAPECVRGNVKGISGQQITVSAVGTLKWTIDDDDGKAHSFFIPGSLYVPSSPARLFSPQHWAQTQKDNHPIKDGTWQGTKSSEVFLNWGQRQFWRHITYNKANVATVWTTPGSRRYTAFKAVFDQSVKEADQEPISFNATVVTDDEAEEWERDASGRWTPSYHDDGESDSDEEIDVPPLRKRDEDDEGTDNDGDGPKQTPTRPKRTVNKPNRIFDVHRPDGASESEMREAVSEVDGKSQDTDPLTSFQRYQSCEVIRDNVDIENELEQAKMTPRAELISWHYRTGHLPFKRLKAMAEQGIIPRRLADCRIPKCSACIYGKMTRRSKRTKAPMSKVGGATITAPGQCVSVDQLESSTPGFIAQMKGIPTTERYRGATVYVDHHSRLSYIYMHRRLTSDETVKGKRAFERYCEARGVTVKHYHADNGRFADNLFVQHVSEKQQSISYCGVNAHWQNGIAEKRIRDLQDQTRIMLLHAESKWPKVITTNLWPYALRCANDALNNTPRGKDKKGQDRGVPINIFTASEARTVTRHFHPFGCPTYVLNSKLQAGQSLPKWHKKARLGVYLGRSPRHAQSVALVMNLSTGLVSPAFHVGFDDHFETLDDHDDYPNKWKAAAHFGRFSPSRRKKLAKSGKGDGSTGLAQENGAQTMQASNDIQDQDNGEVPTEHDIPTDDADEDEQANVETVADPVPDLIPRASGENASVEDAQSRAVRWSTRHKPTQRLRESGQYFGNAFASIDAIDEDYDGEEEYEIQLAMQDPIAFAASGDPDIMYLNQAMKQPDKKQFVKAMKGEIDSHTNNKHWIIVPRSEVPRGMDILPTVWAMRRKRRIVSREVYKWKARLNVHGGKQTKGVNYWETYAACLRWSSIRFFLIQSIINGWHTRQVDFVLAYPQADVECDLYVEIPSGFNFRGSRKTHCLKLLKNVYGQKQAGRVWQQHLFAGLREMGFEQSKSDECVFYKGATVFMVYTDDGIFCGPDDHEIQDIINEMGARFNITDEGTIDEYLGVKVTHLPNGTISLTQPHLIDSIIKDMGFRENTKGKPTPAPSTTILQRNEHEDAHDEVWAYRSVIGKLNFLEKSTRPELAYSVHMAARFSNDPKASHSAAVRHIVRYLVGTRDKGIILDPTKHSFTCFCDADFAGLWHKESAEHNAMTAKSRSSYIVMYAGCPVTWASKLQTEIALSSTESEYGALSEASREVIGMMGLMKEVKARMCKETTTIPTIRCSIFEDNEGAIALANLPKLRPRTKHINVKMHWFRRYVKQGVLKILSIDTLDQLADIGTKPLAEELFIKLRQRISGW